MRTKPNEKGTDDGVCNLALISGSEKGMSPKLENRVPSIYENTDDLWGKCSGNVSHP